MPVFIILIYSNGQPVTILRQFSIIEGSGLLSCQQVYGLKGNIVE